MKKQSKAPAHSLATIVAEIRRTFRGDIANIIKRGNLLQEAKDQLERGQWPPWLEENFLMDERTAQRAMAAAKFAAKYDNLSDLRLTKSALYELSSEDYPTKVVKAVLNEAKSVIVSHQRVWEINGDLNPPEPEAVEDWDAEIKRREQEQAEAEAEAEKLLDGPPPDLSPPEPLVPVDFALAQFNSAIKALGELQTKSVNRFTSTTHSADELRKVADFLFTVADGVKNCRVIDGSFTETPDPPRSAAPRPS
jgi:hypothetical protein